MKNLIKKLRLYTLPIYIIALFFVSCSDDDPVVEPVITEDTETETEAVKIENEINDFIWKGMNLHYYWQSNVNNLKDNAFSSNDEYASFLNSYSEPKALYEDLQFQRTITDRFSFFIEDYNSFDESRRGINDAFGFKFGAVYTTANEVIGYVTYVTPDSPASSAGLKRGDVFYKFNDIVLTENNYSQFVNAYYNDDSIKLSFADVIEGIPVSNGKEDELILTQVIENPVHHFEVIEQDGVKIGYLLYNSFINTYHEELNDAFKEFKDAGITELVLDLRYNSGGSVLTSSFLASMIHGGASESEIFAKLKFNSKNSNENYSYPFYNSVYFFDKTTGNLTNGDSPAEMHRLNTLSRLFILTSDNTASASEMIINGLKPYLNEVVLIGDTTYGKNVGSFTIYDSPNFGPNNINPNHNVAIQPITLLIFNKNDESDYVAGFDPNFKAIEAHYAEYGLKPFGNPEEALLKVALDQITGLSSKSSSLAKKNPNAKKLDNPELKRPFATDMYISPEDEFL